MAWLHLKEIVVAFGGHPVLDGVDLHVERGERLCLLGRNGAGKSTLLKVLQGDLEPDGGEVVRPPGLRVAGLSQAVPASLAGTVFDVVASGVDLAPLDDEGRGRRVRTAISRMGLDAEAEVGPLSTGLKRRALLARALAAESDLLLLDEPTNHLDIDAIGWLEEFLRRLDSTLLFVTHDRAFLRRLATGILDLDRGRLTRAGADYDRYRERKESSLVVEARSQALFDKRLAREEAWIREGVRERRKRNQGRVRRLDTMRVERQDRRERPGMVRLQAQAAGPSGRLVVQTRNAGFAWDGKPVVDGLTTTILRGDRIGIVGPNGSGKTTLLRLLLGDLEPTQGEVRLGANIQAAFFEQIHAGLDDDATAADNVTGGPPTVTVNGRTRHVIGYLRDFLFTPSQVRSPIKDFSGGEKARLALARLFARPSNLLVLDEPTNDLDLETLELLESLLLDYEGTILLVSHDRELLDDVVTSTLVLEGGGRVGEYVGGYSDAVRQRTAASEPKPRRTRPAKPPRPRSALTKDERQELRLLPERIEGLEAEQASLHEAMADPAFFQQKGEQIAKARAHLEVIEKDIEAAYARWQALEARQQPPG